MTIAHTPAQARSFAIGPQDFLLDGKPFVIRSGEMHFSRIPKPLWRHRLKMIKALGLNTVCAYMFWNAHEADRRPIQLFRLERCRRILSHGAGRRLVCDSAARPVCVRRVGIRRLSVLAVENRRHQTPHARPALSGAGAQVLAASRPAFGAAANRPQRPDTHGAGRKRIRLVWLRQRIYGHRAR